MNYLLNKILPENYIFFSQANSKAVELKVAGNKSYGEGKYDEAVQKYKVRRFSDSLFTFPKIQTQLMDIFVLEN